MAKNAIVTDYDDAGYPQAAAFTTSLAASGSVKTAPGRLFKAVVTTALSAAPITIYDNTAASGTILFVIPASAAAGSVYDIQLPAVNGIYASFGGTGTVTFAYS
jgi:hypothetical protein